MRVFGLDICDTSLALVLLEKERGKIKIINQTRIELEKDIIENGEIKDKEKLTQALKKIINESKVKTPYFIFSIPDSQTFNYIFEFPLKLKEKEIEKTLPYEAESVIPLSSEEIYWDFQIISQDGVKEVFYVCCLKILIDDYLEVFKRCKLIPLICDIETNSLARTLIKDLKKEEGIIICDVGARTTTISIFDLNGIRLSFSYEVAGNNLSLVLAESLKITKENAERSKKRYGIEREEEKLILQPLLEKIIYEINKIKNYYQTKTKRKIFSVLLSGGSSKLKGLQKFFQEKLELKIEIAKPWFLKNFVSEAHFVNALGLALRGLDRKSIKKGINLLPKKGKYGIINIRRILKLILIIFSLFLAIFLGFFYKDKLLSFFKLPFKPKEIIKEKIELNFTVLLKNFLEEEIEKTKNFQSTGIKTSEKQAQGKVIIFNQTSTRKLLVAKTRLLTDDKLFRLSEETSIPALGSITAKVYSDKPGKEGEIEKGVKFTIPGLSLTLQKLVYAEAKEKFAGGIEKVKIIGEEDLKKASENLKEEIKKDGLSTLEKKIKEKENLIEKSLTLEIEKEEKPRIGEEKENFDFKIKAKVKIAFFNQEEILEEAKKILKEKIKDKKIENFELKNLKYNFLEIKEGKARVEFKVEAVEK